MSRNISTGARRTVVSTLAALVLAVALPQAGFAQTTTIRGQIGFTPSTVDAGIWKLNSAKSSINPSDGSQKSTLTITRSTAPQAKGDPIRLLVIANGKVYIATGQTAKDALSGKRVDPKRMVQIGSSVRSNDHCASECQWGWSQRRTGTLTFTTQGGQAQALAYGR